VRECQIDICFWEFIEYRRTKALKSGDDKTTVRLSDFMGIILRLQE
jgi:hypothetical protein